MKPSEYQIQNSFFQWYTQECRIKDLLICANKNDFARGNQAYTGYKNGFRPGIPDISVIYKGCCFYIEFKSEEGKLRPSQKKFIRDTENTVVTLVLRNVDEAIRAVEQFVDFINKQNINLVQKFYYDK